MARSRSSSRVALPTKAALSIGAAEPAAALHLGAGSSCTASAARSALARTRRHFAARATAASPTTTHHSDYFNLSVS